MSPLGEPELLDWEGDLLSKGTGADGYISLSDPYIESNVVETVGRALLGER
jgi:hypothetical protein